MLKAIYLSVILQLNNSDLSVAQKRILADDLSKKAGAMLQQGTPSARLTGEVRQSRLVTESGGPALKLIVYLEGEQEPAQNFAALAVTELQTLIADVLAQGGFPFTTSHIEENRNALEELDEDSDSAVN